MIINGRWEGVKVGHSGQLVTRPVKTGDWVCSLGPERATVTGPVWSREFQCHRRRGHRGTPPVRSWVGEETSDSLERIWTGTWASDGRLRWVVE